MRPILMQSEVGELGFPISFVCRVIRQSGAPKLAARLTSKVNYAGSHIPSTNFGQAPKK